MNIALGEREPLAFPAIRASDQLNAFKSGNYSQSPMHCSMVANKNELWTFQVYGWRMSLNFPLYFFPSLSPQELLFISWFPASRMSHTSQSLEGSPGLLLGTVLGIISLTRYVFTFPMALTRVLSYLHSLNWAPAHTLCTASNFEDAARHVRSTFSVISEK